MALYAALVDEIERRIQAGMKPGDPLPSESELQVAFGVSRATVRQALATLERRGLIERRQGRGTFVSLPPMNRPLPELTGFSEHVWARGMEPSSVLVDYRRVGATPADDSRFFPAGTPLVRVVRIRRANEVPVGLHTVYVPLDIATHIGFTEEVLKADASVSLYALLAQSGIRLAYGEERLRARLVEPHEAQLLGVARNTPVMSVLRETFDDRDVLIEVVRAIYLGDKYDYLVRLERGHGGTEFGGVVTPTAVTVP